MTQQFPGLTSHEVLQSREEHGENQLPSKRSSSFLTLFLKQFKDFIIAMLLIASIFSFFLGDIAEAVSIFIIVVVNSLLASYQEFKAEKSLEELKQKDQKIYRTLRQEGISLIDKQDLVVGDLVFLEAGDLVPADMIYLEGSHFSTNESMLTGESVSIEKNDTDNQLFSGSLVNSGRCKAKITAVGKKSAFGKIAFDLQSASSGKTPLQEKMNRFGQKLALALILLGLLVFALGIARGQDLWTMIFFTIALCVAGIPEGLPAVITYGLSMGAKELYARKALIRKLNAVEALGSVDIICTDKTGTLTQNKMLVKEIHPAQDNLREKLLQAMALNNDCSVGDSKEVMGEATEKAIMEFVIEHAPYQEFIKEYPRLNEIPFNSQRKRMSTLHKNSLFTKGALESLLPLMHFETENEKEMMIKKAETAAAQGMRVMIFAYKNISLHEEKLREEDEQNLTYLGMNFIYDPPRLEVKEALKCASSAGLKVVMMTGDHPATAKSIGEEIGLPKGDVLTGHDLEQLNETEILEKLPRISVLARLNPSQKINLVRLYKKMNLVVAMTGDGVNDAPALKEANIGISMGSGTEVSKEASSITLKDDNFSTIIKAIEEGRKIFTNLNKFIIFALAGNISEMMVIVLASFANIPLPFTALQLLWINLVTDGLPGLAMMNEKKSSQLMHRPPKDFQESFTSNKNKKIIGYLALLLCVATLSAFYLGLKESYAIAQTMSFTTMSITQLFFCFVISNLEKREKFSDYFANKSLLLVIFMSLIMQIFLVINQNTRSLFKLEMIPAHLLLEMTLIILSATVLSLGARKLAK